MLDSDLSAAVSVAGGTLCVPDGCLEGGEALKWHCALFLEPVERGLAKVH